MSTTFILKQEDTERLEGLTVAASKDFSRRILCGVLFTFKVVSEESDTHTRNGGNLEVTATVTDSYRLAQQFFTIEQDDMGDAFIETEIPSQPILVSAKELKDALVKVRGGAHAIFTFTKDGLEITVNRAGATTHTNLGIIDGQFPKFAQFFRNINFDDPEEGATGPAETAFNPTYLGQVGVMLGVHKTDIPIRFHFQSDSTKPVGLSLTQHGVLRARGLLMPVRERN